MERHLKSRLISPDIGPAFVAAVSGTWIFSLKQVHWICRVSATKTGLFFEGASRLSHWPHFVVYGQRFPDMSCRNWAFRFLSRGHINSTALVLAHPFWKRINRIDETTSDNADRFSVCCWQNVTERTTLMTKSKMSVADRVEPLRVTCQPLDRSRIFSTQSDGWGKRTVLAIRWNTMPV